MEKTVTLFLMKKFGIENVRGGPYVKINYEKQYLKKKIREQESELRQINLF